MMMTMGVLGGAVPLLVLAVFIFGAVSAINLWKKNNAAPRLSVEAAVEKKYSEVTQHNFPAAGDPTGAHGTAVHMTTDYYAVFRVESGDTMTFSVDTATYEALEQGQSGILRFQGSRFQGFERKSE